MRSDATTAWRTCGLTAHGIRHTDGRRMTRWGHAHIRERLHTRGEAHPGLRQQRQQLVAHPVGTSKHWNDPGSCLMRGLENVRADMRLSALAYHITRVIHIRGSPTLLAPIAGGGRLPSQRALAGERPEGSRGSSSTSRAAFIVSREAGRTDGPRQGSCMVKSVFTQSGAWFGSYIATGPYNGSSLPQRLPQQCGGLSQHLFCLSNDPADNLGCRDNVADHPCSLSGQGHQFCQPLGNRPLHFSLEALQVLRCVVAPLEPGREERRAERTW